MSTKAQKLMQEVEFHKKKMLKLVFGQDDELIVDSGCKALRNLLKLYSMFKGTPSQQAIIKENFLGIYNHLLQTPTIPQQKEFSKIANKNVVQWFGSNLKEIHYHYVLKAQDRNDAVMLEFHLRNCVAYDPSDPQMCEYLCQFYMDNSNLTNALLSLNHYTGPFAPVLFYSRLYCLGKMCDFEAIDKEVPTLKELLKKGESHCILLFLKWIGMDNDTVFQASKNYQQQFEGKQDFIFKGTMEPGRKIRLAYIGSNFIPHAQSKQFGPTFFSSHGDNFEIFIYSLRGDGESESEKCIQKQVNHYLNLKKIDDEEIISTIRNDQIDIIVNCNGHADDRRPYNILCRRVAPIQIDYLGYPGTSGATYIDYYIGDPISTPIKDLAPYFTEKLILLPHTYQVTEHAHTYKDNFTEKPSLGEIRKTILHNILTHTDQYKNEVLSFEKKAIINEISQLYINLYKGNSPASATQDQAEWLQKYIDSQGHKGEVNIKLFHCLSKLNLLISALNGDELSYQKICESYLNHIIPTEEFVRGRFIFCSLNHHVKLTSKDIECWNEILKQTPESVLILFLMFSHEPQVNLLKHFDPEVRERIYFVGSASKSLHLQRLQAIDCILDSLYYGAHTTAGDAIWTQVPIVTRPGEGMEAKVCSSMLQAAGLEEFIAKDIQDYIACAFKCANDRHYYHSYQEKLKKARHSPLFDQELYVNHLTKGYRKAWENFCEVKPLDHIVVTDPSS